MKFTDYNEVPCYIPVWGCGFETNSKKLTSNRDTTFMYRKEPMFGIVVPTRYEDEIIRDLNEKVNVGKTLKEINNDYYWGKTFIPFKKTYKGNGENWTTKDLAFSKSVVVYAREYASTYNECIEVYNDLIEHEIDKCNEFIEKLESYKILLETSEK